MARPPSGRLSFISGSNVVIEAGNRAKSGGAAFGLRRLSALLLLAACVLAPRAARATDAPKRAPGAQRDWPCSGCITVVPPSYSPERPAPLMVALHGDGASTDLVVRMWREPLERRGYLLLALRCPRELGCENSFWRWHGDPAWIMAKVDAVEAAYSIDPSRVYLSGWSGGSTYMGLSAPLLSPRFAAINLNGGGVPPPSGECGTCKPPVYYFAGSRNPMISLVRNTADHFKRCGHEVVWDLGQDLDHPGELQAIFAGPVAERVVAWLDTKRNTCLESAASAAAGPDAGEPAPGALLNVTENAIELTSNTTVVNSGVEPTFGAEEPRSTAPEPAKPKSAAPVPGGCGCRPTVVATVPPVWLLFVAAGLLRARRQPNRRLRARRKSTRLGN